MQQAAGSGAVTGPRTGGRVDVEPIMESSGRGHETTRAGHCCPGTALLIVGGGRGRNSSDCKQQSC